MHQDDPSSFVTRADLVMRLVRRTGLDFPIAEHVVKHIIERLSQAFTDHERVEIRGFGSFDVKHHYPRRARNPRTGESILTEDHYTLHFKPGKELRERVNAKRGKKGLG